MLSPKELLDTKKLGNVTKINILSALKGCLGIKKRSCVLQKVDLKNLLKSNYLRRNSFFETKKISEVKHFSN